MSNLEKGNKLKVGTVYLLRSGKTDYYKVGMTDQDVENRIYTMQTGNPERIEIIYTLETSMYLEIERTIHRMLSPYSYSGEWFKIVEEDITDTVLPIFAFFELHLEGKDQFELRNDYKGVNRNTIALSNSGGKVYTFMDGNGKLYDNITNLSAFAREQGLTYVNIYQVARGIVRRHKKWTLVEVKNIDDLE
jgi:hypothetical protein